MSSVYGLVVFRPIDFFLLLNKAPGINQVIKSNAGALSEHFISRTGMGVGKARERKEETTAREGNTQMCFSF